MVEIKMKKWEMFGFSSESKAPLRQVEGLKIPAEYVATFTFEKNGHYWEADLIISVAESGSPTLQEIRVRGYAQLDSWKYDILEVEQPKTSLTQSVERWQINLITQLRHDLFKTAVSWPLLNGGNSRHGLTEKQVRAIERKIDKKISQRVVNDEFLKKVAEIYSQAELNGLSDPIKEVEAFTQRSHRRSQEYVQMARDHEKQFLPPTTQGKITVRKPTRRKGK